MQDERHALLAETVGEQPDFTAAGAWVGDRLGFLGAVACGGGHGDSSRGARIRGAVLTVV
ncbi:hypothetical protein ACFXPS_44035 [Nocardia sp. NPDC059091]|uniref:hypothetical protein n=1 Tax=unclassified Nocardia TaxID=2637762 RepID=UPI0036902E9D